MERLNVDTERMQSCGSDIIRLTNELSNTIAEMYKYINNMPDVTLEWVGTPAIRFVQKLNNDRIDYNKFIEELSQYGVFLQNAASQLNDTAGRLRV